MAWQDEMGELLRVMVWDMTTPPTYPDDSLQRVLVASAQMVETEMDFLWLYVADIPNRDIVPDPTDPVTRDDNFVNLVCMRAAAIIDQGVARTEPGIVIRDNGSSVDLRGKLEAALKLVALGWAKEYEQQKLVYQAGLLHNGIVGAAVIGPFRSMASEVFSWGEPGDTYLPREGLGTGLWF